MKRQRIKKGEKAQFDGVLLTDGLLAKIKTEHDKEIKLLKLQLERLKRERAVEQKTAAAICKAKVQAERSKLDACNSDRERQADIYSKALQGKSPPSPIWHYLSFLGGALVAGGICVGVDRAGR